jgi:CRISPR-associated protein Cas2
VIVLVCYDISNVEAGGARRLRRIAEACLDYGVRVQYSVFECRIEAVAWVQLRHRLLQEFDAEQDSLRFYFINAKDVARTEHHGVRPPVDPTGPLVV